MHQTFVKSAEELRGRISNVKYIPFAPGQTLEAIQFEIDGIPHHGVLKGRNLNLMLGGALEADCRIALRVLLDGDASPKDQ